MTDDNGEPRLCPDCETPIEWKHAVCKDCIGIGCATCHETGLTSSSRLRCECVGKEHSATCEAPVPGERDR